MHCTVSRFGKKCLVNVLLLLAALIVVVFTLKCINIYVSSLKKVQTLKLLISLISLNSVNFFLIIMWMFKFEYMYLSYSLWFNRAKIKSCCFD